MRVCQYHTSLSNTLCSMLISSMKTVPVHSSGLLEIWQQPQSSGYAQRPVSMLDCSPGSRSSAGNLGRMFLDLKLIFSGTLGPRMSPELNPLYIEENVRILYFMQLILFLCLLLSTYVMNINQFWHTEVVHEGLTQGTYTETFSEKARTRT